MVSFGKFSIAIAGIAALAAVSGAAQTTESQPKFQAVVCPVMKAEHSPGLTEQVPVGKDGSVSGPAIRRDGQHLVLRLTNSSWPASTISAIRITVHGWRSGTGRTLPAQKTNSDNADASRTLNLTVNIAPHETVDKDVWVSGLASVDSIDVDRVKFVNGLSMRLNDSGGCRIVPDPEMLVSSR
jgi:hypothetical protein